MTSLDAEARVWLSLRPSPCIIARMPNLRIGISASGCLVFVRAWPEGRYTLPYGSLVAHLVLRSCMHRACESPGVCCVLSTVGREQHLFRCAPQAGNLGEGCLRGRPSAASALGIGHPSGRLDRGLCARPSWLCGAATGHAAGEVPPVLAVAPDLWHSAAAPV